MVVSVYSYRSSIAAFRLVVESESGALAEDIGIRVESVRVELSRRFERLGNFPFRRMMADQAGSAPDHRAPRAGPAGSRDRGRGDTAGGARVQPSAARATAAGEPASPGTHRRIAARHGRPVRPGTGNPHGRRRRRAHRHRPGRWSTTMASAWLSGYRFPGSPRQTNFPRPRAGATRPHRRQRS